MFIFSGQKVNTHLVGGWKLSVVLHNILVAYDYSVGRKVCWRIARFIILHTHTHMHTIDQDVGKFILAVI